MGMTIKFDSIRNGIFMAVILWVVMFFFLFKARADDLPRIAEWENNMRVFGAMHCNTLTNGTPDEKLAATYYDAISIYQQIGRYTGETKWKDCETKAFAAYGKDYVLANGGNVPGYWIFSRGLADRFLGIGEQDSKLGVTSLSTSAAYARDSTPEGSTVDFTMSREVAYSIMAYLDAERVGEPRRARLSLLVSQALGHLDQYADPNKYVKPFFIALTSQALIQYYEQVEAKPEIVSKLSNIAQIMWDRAWVESAGAMRYVDKVVQAEGGDNAPTADLNLLIVPLYGWLGKVTHDPKWITYGDKLWTGGVTSIVNGSHAGGAYIWAPKIFNQNYRWSFNYVRWRGEAQGTGVSPTLTSTPAATRTPYPTTTPTRTPTSCSTARSLAAHECRLNKLEAKK